MAKGGKVQTTLTFLPSRLSFVFFSSFLILSLTPLLSISYCVICFIILFFFFFFLFLYPLIIFYLSFSLSLFLLFYFFPLFFFSLSFSLTNTRNFNLTSDVGKPKVIWSLVNRYFWAKY